MITVFILYDGFGRVFGVYSTKEKAAYYRNHLETKKSWEDMIFIAETIIDEYPSELKGE